MTRIARSRGCAGRLAAVLLVLLMPSSYAIDAQPEFADPVLQARYERLIHELRCLKCQNNSIADSPSEVAVDLRRRTYDLVQQGKSEEEILAYMTDRYGDFVRYRPPFAPRTWLLWLAPILLLGGGALIAYRIISRRARMVGADEEENIE